jgi:chaperonin GroEL (HSP60 family)
VTEPPRPRRVTSIIARSSLEFLVCTMVCSVPSAVLGALSLPGTAWSTHEAILTFLVRSCRSFRKILIGEDKLIRFSGCKSGEACSVVLRGASSHLLDEAERSLHDALCVLSQTVKETRTIPGGGCAEISMARAIGA